MVDESIKKPVIKKGHNVLSMPDIFPQIGKFPSSRKSGKEKCRKTKTWVTKGSETIISFRAAEL
jgi:hypothetical protein